MVLNTKLEVFNSTLVVNGEAWGSEHNHLTTNRLPIEFLSLVVVRTGDHTFIGEFPIIIWLTHISHILFQDKSLT